MNLEGALATAEIGITMYLLEKALNDDARSVNRKFTEPCLIFLNNQTHSVPLGALVGYLVGSKQDKIYEALEFIEAMIELDYIDIREVNGNWVVDPIHLEYEASQSLGIDVRPFRKSNRDVFCGKLIHNPRPTRTEHLDYLGNIKFKLNREFIEAFPNVPETAPYKKTLPSLLNSIEGNIYSDHKYDTRGRTYAAGHINYQGTEYEKCLLQFSKEEATTYEGLKNLDSYINNLKPSEKYLAFVARQALLSQKTGIFIGADASASGMQIIATLYGCTVTGTNVGLLDKSKDAYTLASETVDFSLADDANVRDIFKQCCMQHSYGGTKTPLSLLGKENYKNFIETMWKLFPAVQEYLSIIQKIYYKTPVFTWTLPDGFEVQQPVIQTRTEEFHLPHDKEVVFGYAYKTLIQKDEGLEMAANVVHSIDGYIARELIYRASKGSELIPDIKEHLLNAIVQTKGNDKKGASFSLYTLLNTPTNMWALFGKSYLDKALAYVARAESLSLPSFQVISVHDDFKSHPNYIHHIKWLYLEILADIADSNLLKDIIEEINPNVVAMMPKAGHSFATNLRLARGNGNAKGLT